VSSDSDASTCIPSLILRTKYTKRRLNESTAMARPAGPPRSPRGDGLLSGPRGGGQSPLIFSAVDRLSAAVLCRHAGRCTAKKWRFSAPPGSPRGRLRATGPRPRPRPRPGSRRLAPCGYHHARFRPATCSTPAPAVAATRRQEGGAGATGDAYREMHRVGPEFASWPSGLTRNPD
jgi:hypothetical protein